MNRLSNNTRLNKTASCVISSSLIILGIILMLFCTNKFNSLSNVEQDKGNYSFVFIGFILIFICCLILILSLFEIIALIIGIKNKFDNMFYAISQVVMVGLLITFTLEYIYVLIENGNANVKEKILVPSLLLIGIVSEIVFIIRIIQIKKDNLVK